MNVIIRKAALDDALTVWNIRNAAIRAQCNGHYSNDQLAIWTAGNITDRFAKVVAERFYVATIEETIVGTGMIGCSSGHVDAIFVHPDNMGQGVGTQMMNCLENIAVETGLKKLTLDSTLNAVAFYRKCGFVGDQVGTYESPRGISLACVPMSKDISIICETKA